MLRFLTLNRSNMLIRELKRFFHALNDSVAQAIVKKEAIFNDSKNLLSKKALFLTIAGGDAS